MPEKVGKNHGGQRFGGGAPKVNDGELSELQEEDDDDLDQSEATQNNFHAGRTAKTNDEARRTQAVLAAAASEERLEKMEKGFTKQIEAMQTLINQ